MSIVNKTYLKSIFSDGNIPTQSDYMDLIDTLNNKNTSIDLEILSSNNIPQPNTFLRGDGYWSSMNLDIKNILYSFLNSQEAYELVHINAPPPTTTTTRRPTTTSTTRRPVTTTSTTSTTTLPTTTSTTTTLPITTTTTTLPTSSTTTTTLPGTTTSTTTTSSTTTTTLPGTTTSTTTTSSTTTTTTKNGIVDYFRFSDTISKEVIGYYWDYSEKKTITGVNVPITWTTWGCQCCVNDDGVWTTSGTLYNGSTIQLRTHPPFSGMTVSRWNNIVNGEEMQYNWYLIAPDRVPDQFNFNDIEGGILELGNQYYYNITPTGFDGITYWEITSSDNVFVHGQVPGNGAWTQAGTILPGNTLQLSMKSPDTHDAEIWFTLNIGSITATCHLRTKPDSAPDPFNIPSDGEILPINTTYLFDFVPTGYTTTVSWNIFGSVYGKTDPNGVWSQYGSISPGQRIYLNLTTPSTFNTNFAATIMIGETSQTFSWKTQLGI